IGRHEPELRKAALQWHLTAFESFEVHIASASLLALAATPGGLPQPEPLPRPTPLFPWRRVLRSWGLLRFRMESSLVYSGFCRARERSRATILRGFRLCRGSACSSVTS